MSLNLTIINPFGIWQCADHRLVNTATMRVEDDDSIKQVKLRCRDGTAIISYAGIGKLDGVHVSDWIREILRGESRTVDQSLIFLRESATRDLGPYLNGRLHHMFSVGVMIRGKPWIAQVRNFSPTSSTNPLAAPPVKEFETVAMPVTDGCAAAFPPLVIGDDVKTLVRVSTRRPRDPEEFSNLLATINRRVSAGLARKVVSAHCVTTYVPAAGEPFSTKFHDTTGVARGMIVPMVMFGIDATEVMKEMIKRPLREGPPPELSDAASRSVQPINRLRRRLRAAPAHQD